MVYEFECEGCGETVESVDRDVQVHVVPGPGGCTEHLAAESFGGLVHASAFCPKHTGGVCRNDPVGCGGLLKRRWSFSVAWPAHARGH